MNPALLLANSEPVEQRDSLAEQLLRAGANGWPPGLHRAAGYNERGEDAGNNPDRTRGIRRVQARPMALFVSHSGLLMPAPREGSGEGWSIERAEELLRSLTGVLSVRVVADQYGEIEEIHVLTTEQIGPKQTVRNVESALLAHLDKVVDHRRISVAQTKEVGPKANGGEVNRISGLGKESRILFLGHQTEPDRSHQVRYQVQVEWRGNRFTGDASGADLPRARLETVANATLRGVEAAVATGRGEEEPSVALALDGVRLVEAFERTYALVAIHAIGGREVMRLSGAAIVDGAPDRAVIMATLQATDRWVRGRLREKRKEKKEQ